jgi:hypothetical protein
MDVQSTPISSSLLTFRTEHLKLRTAISITMLLLAFIGVVITDFTPAHAWKYWSFTTLIFAFICVSLSFLTARKYNSFPFALVGREALHWFSLIVMVYLVALFMHFGVLSDVLAGLFILTLLTLTTLLAGIHFDAMYILVGLVLAIFALVSAAFVQYFMLIALITLLVAGVALVWQFKKR